MSYCILQINGFIYSLKLYTNSSLWNTLTAKLPYARHRKCLYIKDEIHIIQNICFREGLKVDLSYTRIDYWYVQDIMSQKTLYFYYKIRRGKRMSLMEEIDKTSVNQNVDCL